MGVGGGSMGGMETTFVGVHTATHYAYELAPDDCIVTTFGYRGRIRTTALVLAVRTEGRSVKIVTNKSTYHVARHEFFQVVINGR